MFFLPTYPIFQNHVIGTTHIFCFGLTYNSAEHENDNILITAKELDQICVKIILAMSCFKIKREQTFKMASLTKNNRV